jgi:hypothetical protein
MSIEGDSTPQNLSETSVSTKIMGDLGVVKEKIQLCESILNPGEGLPTPSLKDNEVLLSVIGFLEACSPRMVELVEAGTQGALSELVLMECLAVNDKLMKLLETVDTYAFIESPASTTAASAPSVSLEHEISDMSLHDDNSKQVPGTTDILDLLDDQNSKLPPGSTS